MSEALWKVGELARRTGVSVRTLHHYDELGLLRPSHHTGSGHRLYTGSDVARLQQILSLKQLGFSLEEIRRCLRRTDFSPRRVVTAHLNALRELIARQQVVCDRLAGLAAALEASSSEEEVSSESFLNLVESMMSAEQYYTAEQLEYLAERKKLFSDEQMKQAQDEWTDLMARVKSAMENGVDPTGPEVLAMARRWKEKVEEFTGGDPGILQSLNKMYAQPGVKEQHGGSQEMWDYIGKAMAGLKAE